MIDGVVGIGATGPLRPNAAAVFAATTAPVVAVDLPSGIDVQTGATDGPHAHELPRHRRAMRWKRFRSPAIVAPMSGSAAGSHT